MKVTNLTCPNCQARILSDDINLANLVAVCRQCHGLIDLREPSQPLAPQTQAQTQVPQPMAYGWTQRPVRQPDGTTLQRDRSGFSLTYRWYSPLTTTFLLLFSLIWFGMLIPFYTSILSRPGIDLLPKLFPLLHIGAGLVVAYIALASLLNYTTYAIANGWLTVRHRPFPWREPSPLSTSEIDQIYVQRKESYHTSSSGFGGPRQVVTYEICAQTKRGEHIRLDGGIESVDVARFIEQELERFLGIVDYPVPGEIWEK